MIDLEFLNSVAKSDKSFYKTMLEIFLKQTPESIDNLTEGLVTKDFDRIKAAAHKMKSSMGFMGMKETEIVCQKVEESSKNKSISEIKDLIEEIKANCEIAFQEVKKELETC